VTDFLLLTLYAPLASWGDIAVGEVRDSWDSPSRSAVLGLVAASLGIDREDQSAHDGLDASLGVAVCLDVPGVSTVDYQTVQTATASWVKKHKPRTRRELLEADDLATILSRRTLRLDTLARAAIWLRCGASTTLADLRVALERPVFTLYAGRKANVLGLPIAPRSVTAPTVVAAFLADAAESATRVLGSLSVRAEWQPVVSSDIDTEVPTGLVRAHRVQRRDDRPHRGRWQFANRQVEVGNLRAPEVA
jgi:CRISPR system Cascade subunit CasD